LVENYKPYTNKASSQLLLLVTRKTHVNFTELIFSAFNQLLDALKITSHQ